MYYLSISYVVFLFLLCTTLTLNCLLSCCIAMVAAQIAHSEWSHVVFVYIVLLAFIHLLLAIISLRCLPTLTKVQGEPAVTETRHASKRMTKSLRFLSLLLFGYSLCFGGVNIAIGTEYGLSEMLCDIAAIWLFGLIYFLADRMLINDTILRKLIHVTLALPR